MRIPTINKMKRMTTAISARHHSRHRRVVSLFDRASGQIRSYTFDQMISCYIEPVLKANITKEAG